MAAEDYLNHYRQKWTIFLPQRQQQTIKTRCLDVNKIDSISAQVHWPQLLSEPVLSWFWLSLCCPGLLSFFSLLPSSSSPPLVFVSPFLQTSPSHYLGMTQRKYINQVSLFPPVSLIFFQTGGIIFMPYLWFWGRKTSPPFWTLLLLLHHWKRVVLLSAGRSNGECGEVKV